MASKSSDAMRARISTSEPSVSIFTMCALGRTSGDLVSTSTVFVVCSPISRSSLPAIVAAKVEPRQARIADGKVVQAHRPALELSEVSLEQREIGGERFVALDVSLGPALERPGRETPG